MSIPKNVLYYGKNEALPAVTELRAGPLSMIYEAGDLRYLRLGQQEILRRVYVAVRDHNWRTILPSLSNVRLDAGSDSFRISYDVENRDRDIDFVWRGTISGDAQGTVIFTMDGKARSTFLRNRIGFCILHPMACSGLTCQIEHIDGTVEAALFPDDIAPQHVKDGHPWPVAPFDNMRAMSYQVKPDVLAEIRFEGDSFEMEDQRNWTDASFKSYGTPLSLPFPVEIKAGTEISQSVTLKLRGDIPSAQPESRDETLRLTLGSTAVGPLPKIGLAVASHGQPLTPTEVERLKSLPLSHLRVDLELWQPDVAHKLRQATAEANALGVLLEVTLILSDAANKELETLAALLDQIKPPVWSWLIFHKGEVTTGPNWIVLAREWLSLYDPQARIGSGTNFFFTELNRSRPAIGDLDLVTYSLSPQFHAFDNTSLVETLEAQAMTVKSARKFSGDLPLTISPITLKPRSSPVATAPDVEPDPNELPPQVDERQMSLFGAGWTLGSLKYMFESGVDSVTYYETTGWRGLMERAAGSPLPEKFYSIPGTVFPLYHILADVGDFVGGEILPTVSSVPLQVEGLALRKEGNIRLLLANLSHLSRQVMLSHLDARLRLRYLDETNVEMAMQSPEEFRAPQGKLVQTRAGMLSVELRPYGLVCIDM